MNFGLTSKITLFALATCLITATFLFFYGARREHDQYQKYLSKHNQSLVKEVTRSLHKELSQGKNTLLLASQTEQVTRYLNASTILHRQKLDQYFQQVLLSHPQFLEITFEQKDTKELTWIKRNQKVFQKQKDLDQKNFLFQKIERHEVFLSKVQHNPKYFQTALPQELTTKITTKVVDDKNQKEALLTLKLSLTKSVHWPQEQSRFLFIDQSGNKIFDSLSVSPDKKEGHAKNDEHLISQLKTFLQDQGKAFSYTSQNHYHLAAEKIHYNQLSPRDFFILVSLVSANPFSHNFLTNILDFFPLLFLLLLASGSFSWYFSSRLKKPITRIHEKVKNLVAPDQKALSHCDKNIDEFQLLSQHVFLLANNLIEKNKSLATHQEGLNNAAIVTEFNENGLTTYVNHNFCFFTGFSEHDLLFNPSKLIDKQVMGAVEYDRFWELLKTGRPWRGELQGLKKSGQPFWLDTAIYEAYHNGQKIFVAICFDITTRKVIEKELVRASNFISRQKEALDICAIVAETDRNGTITYVNEKFIEISGYSEKELLGKNHHIIRSGHHTKDFFIELWSTIIKGDIWRGEIKNRAKNGSHYWVDTTIFPVKDSNGSIERFISIRFDTTEIKRVHQELKEASEKSTREAEIKSSFLANMSHEIRTPMNLIIGISDVLSETKLSKEQAHYVDMFKRSGESLLRIINDILDISKIDSGEFKIENKVFNIEDLLDEISFLMKVKCSSKGLMFKIKKDEKIKYNLYGDSDRIKQVLMNLLGNALKFTRQGSITLTATQRDDETILFSVNDTGAGITSDRLQHIFERFAQENKDIIKKYGGTGLGLSISKSLINIMGGEISVESQKGIGSTFSFYLPLKEEVSKGPKTKKAEIYHHLVLSDDHAITSLIQGQILEKDQRTLQEKNPQKFIEYVRDFSSRNLPIQNIFVDKAQIRSSSFKGFRRELKECLKLYSAPVSFYSPQYTSVKELNERSYRSIISKNNFICGNDIHDIVKLHKTYHGIQNNSVLVVDNEEEIRSIITHILNDWNIRALEAFDKETSHQACDKNRVNIVMTDLFLDNDKGTHIIDSLRQKNQDQSAILFSASRPKNIDKLLQESNIHCFLEKPILEHHLFESLKSIYEKNANPSIDQKMKVLLVDDSIDNIAIIKLYLKDLPIAVDTCQNGREAFYAFQKKVYDLVLMDLHMPEIDGHQAIKMIRQWERESSRQKTRVIAFSANVLKSESSKSLEVGFDDFLTKPIRKKPFLDFIQEIHKDLKKYSRAA